MVAELTKTDLQHAQFGTMVVVGQGTGEDCPS
jgi:hypothetical protein